MWRLHPYLVGLWGLVLLALILNLFGDCLSGLLLRGSTCDLQQSALNFLQAYGHWIVLFFLVLIVISLLARRSHQHHEAREIFALLKPVEDLSPEDFGFQVLRPGEQPNTHRRPFYPTYISRSASEKAENRAYSEVELVEALEAGKSFILLGQPLDGKSHTLYELLTRMRGYQVVKPSPSKALPPDDRLSAINGAQVILLLEDLHHYVGRQVDLLELYQKLSEHTSSCVVASTCRDGPEQKAVETNLRRLYEQIDLKLRLALPTIADKEKLAEGIGEDWESSRSDDYPTLGSITMKRPMEAMSLRFETLLYERPELADTLRTLKLLTAAGVLPFTHDRIAAVLSHLFGRRGINLRDCLRVLTNQSFLQADESQEQAVQPEPAYLRNSVTYTEGKEPKDDFPKLADVLEDIDDDQGLNYLGINHLLTLQDYKRSLDCFERVVEIRGRLQGRQHPSTLRARSNVGVAMKRQGDLDDALKVYEEVLEDQKRELNPRHHDVASTLLNIGSLLRDKGLYHEVLPRYQEALAIREEALAGIDTEDPERRQLLRDVAESLHNIGYAFMDFGRHQEASFYLERALQIYEKDLNDVRHVWFAGNAMRLGWALRAQKDYRRAWARLARALQIHRQVVGEDNAEAAKNLMNLGTLFKEQSDLDGSLSDTERGGTLRSAGECLEEALTLSMGLHGEENPITGGILRALACVAYAEDRQEDEVSYREQAEAIREKTLAAAKLDSVDDLDKVAKALGSGGSTKRPSSTRSVRWNSAAGPLRRNLSKPRGAYSTWLAFCSFRVWTQRRVHT